MTIDVQRLAGMELEDDIATRFAVYDAKHPEIYKAIVRIALRRLDNGATRLSMKWIAECVREDPAIIRDGRDVVKVDNTFTAMYTRKLIAEYPELAPLFRTRRRHT